MKAAKLCEKGVGVCTEVRTWANARLVARHGGVDASDHALLAVTDLPTVEP